MSFHTSKIMFIIVDLIIGIIFALCIFTSYKRGLAGCIIKVLTFFIAILVSAILFKPVSAIITNTTQIDENIQSSIVSVFEKEDSEDDRREDSSVIMQYIAEKVEKAEEATEEKKMEIVNSVASEISVKIINVLSFIIVFILARVALIFVKVLTDLITKLPLIKECDKIGGVIYGILQSFVIVFIALALITFVSTIISNYSLLELIEKSYIGSILNDYNILLKMVF